MSTNHHLHYLIRRTHRYLGVFIGIQFLLWTLGGLYFSWSDMDYIHGDYQRKAPPMLRVQDSLASPNAVLNNLAAKHPVDQVASIQLIDVLGKPCYRVEIVHGMHHKMFFLADAKSGQLRQALSKKEAVEMAKQQFNGKPNVTKVQYLSATSSHHEYRESPLPAYAIRFDHPSRTTVYVATEMGMVTKFRNEKWRIFDFLWMLHTMDYQSRDNLGNVLLRVFSILGLCTIASGFLLFWVSRRTVKA
ncbi:PepSY domain-containing protein [Haliscomenobacter hydrossis]|uniref:PepSY-associated TM helix domain protein n=1 Tax=Haliscomenobacter hydrossis (strain ATCC 27775 / DSM 1100 / LMG 10767 / O) TaxID=760192 RepID=F4KWH2_HALH1|nr:PepSY domain-containing protein [Haliscomenobacter hydrossis]AEE50322.1 hypothetical protein Halhy_2448 [Haliscomenobacter hydrossis DSM 1100]